MTDIESIVIGKSAIPALIVTVILMLVIPVVFFICRRKEHRQQTKKTFVKVNAGWGCGHFFGPLTNQCPLQIKLL